MARAYAARLGSIAMVSGLLQAFLNGDALASSLIRSIGLMIAFSVAGFFIGAVAESVVRQSVEANFRASLEKSRGSGKVGDTRST